MMTASELYEKYVRFVKQNVEIVSEAEIALKWASYFIAGRGQNSSSILSELIYSASNVITLFNDVIIRQAFKNLTCKTVKFTYDHVISLTLSLIEYLEVFAEISSDRLWGTKGKWIVIAAIQIFKVAIKLFLMMRHRGEILCAPPIPMLTIAQRKLITEKLVKDENEVINSDECQTSNSEVVKDDTALTASETKIFTLKRSGRIMRTVSSDTPITGRTWKPPCNSNNRTAILEIEKPTPLTDTELFAELLHILRPVVHLIVMLRAGPGSWIPWFISCGMDVTSLRLLLSGNKGFNVREKSELRFRKFALLYFLLRSPFYDTITKKRLCSMLESTSNNVPLARIICKPILDYLPLWQNTYFYSWSS